MARAELRIDDLGIISDRTSAALVARDGRIVWYCPERFDRPSLFAALLDPGAGVWRVDLPGAVPLDRRYQGASGVLESRLRTPSGDWSITDWMPAGREAPAGVLCRLFARAPAEVRMALSPRPNYGSERVRFALSDRSVRINDRFALHASHPLRVEGDTILCTLAGGEEAWAVFAPAALPAPSREDLDRWLEITREHWRELSQLASYQRGPYEREVNESLRAIRLLCHEESGGIIAAATTSLPEVPGGERNWDYRYVWLRDTGMIVSALTRLGGDIQEGKRYLDFICGSRGSSREYPLAVFTTLDGKAAPAEEQLGLCGYLGSRPVRIGNNAGDQIQLDAFANVLLAAKLIYQRADSRPHWDVVEQIAEFLVEHWHEPDHGIWEEPARQQYTASKVIVACALSSVAEFSQDPAQAARWRRTVEEIRVFVSRCCLTGEGAYAAVAGGQAVDISAALFPVWAYTAADTLEMQATIAALERDSSEDGLLFRRHLECAGAASEGAFLAGTFWMAQYWVMRGELEHARRIMDAGLAYANDLGLFAEEADPGRARMLGNFPQTFVHAAFIGAAIDLKHAKESAHDRQAQG